MPFYDFICEQCGNQFNIFASISQKQQKQIACPSCKSKLLKTNYNVTSNLYIKKAEHVSCPNFHKCGGCCHEK